MHEQMTAAFYRPSRWTMGCVEILQHHLAEPYIVKLRRLLLHRIGVARAKQVTYQTVPSYILLAALAGQLISAVPTCRVDSPLSVLPKGATARERILVAPMLMRPDLRTRFDKTRSGNVSVTRTATAMFAPTSTLAYLPHATQRERRASVCGEIGDISNSLST